MSAVWEGYRLRPRTLVGATVMQVVPPRCKALPARAAVESARMLVASGARAIVAGEPGPLTAALRATGAEWLPLATSTINPLKLRRIVLDLERYAAAERIDIVHTVGGRAAWIACMAAARTPMWVVTSLPDFPEPRSAARHLFDGAITRGDRVIAPSSFAAGLWIARERRLSDRIAIIPYAIDTVAFAPSAVSPERIHAVRRAWSLHPADRAILVPAPDRGAGAIDAAFHLMQTEIRHAVFVLATDGAPDPVSMKRLAKQAHARGMGHLMRLVAMPADLPAALGAAFAVALAPSDPPASGRILAQAQAMGRPVIATACGALPEHLLAPPRISDGLRTGWVVQRGEPATLAAALQRLLALDPARYQAMAARARRFAEFVFAPERVAAATRAVYTSLLARDA